MAALTEWIGNIIVLILIAVIMELLVPNTSLQQYVKMVIGLLLILILLSPLLHIFSMDEGNMFESIQFSESFSDLAFEKSVNDKKSEIQAAQDAYIEEQMAVQMRNQIDEELMERYEVKVKDIELTLKKDGSGEDETIDTVHVTLTEENRIEPIETIAIGDESHKRGHDDSVNDIRKFLAEKWEINEEVITLDMKGGNL